jgi:hypothetical protein
MIISIPVFAYCLVSSYKAKWEKNVLAACVFGFILAMATVVASQQYTQSITRRAYLESFYQSNATNYKVAADMTASYLSQDKFIEQIIAGSIEKQQLATEISKRIAEWRDGVITYNQILITYKAWDNNLLVGVFVPDLPDYLQTLEIQ